MIVAFFVMTGNFSQYPICLAIFKIIQTTRALYESPNENRLNAVLVHSLFVIFTFQSSVKCYLCVYNRLRGMQRRFNKKKKKKNGVN
jgi:hypothetical protein